MATSAIVCVCVLVTGKDCLLTSIYYLVATKDGSEDHGNDCKDVVPERLHGFGLQLRFGQWLQEREPGLTSDEAVPITLLSEPQCR